MHLFYNVLWGIIEDEKPIFPLGPGDAYTRLESGDRSALFPVSQSGAGRTDGAARDVFSLFYSIDPPYNFARRIH